MKTLQKGLLLSNYAAAAVLSLSIAGCSADQDTQEEAPHRRAGATQSFVFTGEHGSKARVTRTRAADGSEKLSGETVFVHEGAARQTVIEDVTLDAEGRLLRAEITTSDGASREVVRLDAARGRVEVMAGVFGSSFRLQSDAPWVYAPSSAGRTLATPVSAWVARRAPETAPWLNLVSAHERRGYSVARDQLVVPTEEGTTVVLGTNGADVDQVFVQEIRPGGGESALARVGRQALVL